MDANWTEHAVARAIGDLFIRMLEEEVGSEALAAIHAENRHRRNAGDEDSCASHDHIDANEIMEIAFERIVGRPTDAASDADAALWSAAWRAALP